MFYKKVYNYRARLRQANPQQAKHHAEWSPVFLLRALLAWKIRPARRNSNAARITFSVVLFSLLRHVESYRFSSVLFNSFRFLLILVYILRTVILYNKNKNIMKNNKSFLWNLLHILYYQFFSVLPSMIPIFDKKQFSYSWRNFDPRPFIILFQKLLPYPTEGDTAILEGYIFGVFSVFTILYLCKQDLCYTTASSSWDFPFRFRPLTEKKEKGKEQCLPCIFTFMILSILPDFQRK